MSDDILYQKQKLKIYDVLNYIDEIFNGALLIMEDSCSLLSGKNSEQWGLISPHQTQNISLETEILRETSNAYINNNKLRLIDNMKKHSEKL